MSSEIATRVRTELLPPTFAWGVATAAYQIEGAVSEGGRGESIWDRFAHTPGRTRNGETGDIACDHYHRWAADVDLLAELGVNSYRLSFSWTRLQPTGRGKLNPDGVAFYRKLLARLHEKGITPYVTLYHWDLPQALEDEGGWPNRQTAFLFADYVSLVVEEFRDLSDNWITLNEPWCAAFLGYGQGRHAPGRSSDRDGMAAGHHFNLAHGLAVAKIRVIDAGLRVGVTNLIQEFVPLSDSPEDVAAAIRMDAACNRFFLDPIYAGEYSQAVHDIFDQFGLRDLIEDGDLEIISAPTDFVGLNHYQRILVWEDEAAGYLKADSRSAEPAATSIRWSVVPSSLTAVMERVAKEYTRLPMYITENGACYNDYVDPNGQVNDPERVAYLAGYLDAAAEARAKGVDVQGYFAWSFIDNFEWGQGYYPRFGIVYVEYLTQTRIIKQSGRWYSDLIGEHARQVQV